MKKFTSFLMIGTMAAFSVFTSSCSKDKGCTDPSAINYDSNAEEDDGSCRYDNAADLVVKEGTISSNETWTKDNIYRLKGRVYVGGNATLTIEAGTIIKADPGQGAFSSALVVRRGAKLMAMGTEAEPIIFTSVADDIQPGQIASPNLLPTQNGLWGGLVVLGKAQISAQNSNGADVSELQIEGIPTSEDARYGGSDDNDNSGTITYISIRHGGSNIGAGNEINGLTLGGVGSGTTINNVEVVANQDDGIEWFGGSVDMDNVVIWNSGDDGLDTDQDWIGTCTDFLIVTPLGGSAFELDGPEGTLNRGTHQFTNGVVYAGDDIDHLVDWDGSTNAGLKDIYFYGFATNYPQSGFDAIESFGGDGTGDNGNWQYTLTSGGQPVDTIFAGVPPAALTEVAKNANTVGPDQSEFGWTWASVSGALSSIGIPQ